MSKIIPVLLVLFCLGSLVGAFAVYKYVHAKRSISLVREELERSYETIEELSEIIDEQAPSRMVFLHHSVGRDFLNQGGLRKALLDIGIAVRGATYGDRIGQRTDIMDWYPKFEQQMEQVRTFKAHPDRYYSDRQMNDIVMFKSCFPNSDINSDGPEPGDPGGNERTLTNFKASFNKLKKELAAHPDTLFVYMTAPPLVPERTTPENAARARAFNTWVLEEFLPEYRNNATTDNLVIFDLFGLLAGPDHCLKEEYRVGIQMDSHPNHKANKVVVQRFMQFFLPLWKQWQAEPPDQPENAA